MTIFRDTPGLLERFRAGARPAMEVVYWAYVRRIEALVRHGFTARSGAGVRVVGNEGEDSVQEIFARAFAERARLAFDGVRNYEPFLATLARNTVIDWARRQGREIAFGPIEQLPDVAAPPTTDPHADWASPEIAALVQGYLDQLSSELRAVHQQRYVLGQTQADAAAALSLTRQQLRTREARLREGLEQALRAHERGQEKI